MKKFLAILLALMMVLVSAAALAEDDPPAGGEGGGSGEATTAEEYEPGTGHDEGQDTTGNPRIKLPLDNGGAITIKKAYGLTIDTDAKLPNTDIQFTATLDSISDSTVTKAQMSGNDVTISYTPTEETDVSGTTFTDTDNLITIQYPTYPEVGVYTYTIKESSASNTAYAGITFSPDITMKVSVIRDPADKELKIAGIAFREEENGEKLDTITNTYKSGTLVIKKTVTGIMGEYDRAFKIKVTFNSTKAVNGTIGIAISDGATCTQTSIAGGSKWTGDKEVEFTLKHDATITFTNVPDGVTYTILEDSEYATDYGYDAAEYSCTNGQGAITAGSSKTEIVTNNKDMEIDTGVALDSTVYMLILALALVGVVMLKVRRREEY